MTKIAFQNLPNPCHTVPYGLPQRATAVARRGTKNAKPLKTQDNTSVCHKQATFDALKPLILLLETALQPWLRMVCAFDRPTGSKPSPLSSSVPALKAAASKIAQLFGTAAQLVASVVALTSASHADGWTSVSSDTAWSSADRFNAVSSAVEVSKRTARQIPFVRAVRQSQGSEMDRLLTLISQAESPVRGYDAVHYGATVRPPKPPSQMTIAEIVAWVRATPGQPHAIGRNQIIPSTFNRVVRALGLSGSTRYDRRTQDMMGRFLIEEAGYSSFRAGRISRAQFMDNLAKVWAGLPLANGRSHYQGYAGNRATISHATYVSAMAEIFPTQGGSN